MFITKIVKKNNTGEIMLIQKIKYFSNLLSKILLFFFILTEAPMLYARIHDFETTRLMSTAGTGVGSILLEESSLLNPASLGFFANTGSLSYQQTKTKLSPENHPELPDSGKLGVILSDANNNLKGSVSFQRVRDVYDVRKRFSTALAAPVAPKSCMGLAIKYTSDETTNDGNSYVKDKYHQFTIGITHAVKENFTLGVVVNDLFRKHQGDSNFIVGGQFFYENMVALMADIGSDYTSDIQSDYVFRSALQIKLLNDFFLRLGIFRDNHWYEDGSGVGAGWVTPKFMIEFAVKNTNIKENQELNQDDLKIKDMSFNIAARF